MRYAPPLLIRFRVNKRDNKGVHKDYEVRSDPNMRLRVNEHDNNGVHKECDALSDTYYALEGQRT